MDDAENDFTEDDRLFQFNLKQLETLSGDRARAGLQANICRQLVSQLAENVVNQDQEPLARYDQIRDFISRAHDLVDDPKGINNYSDACLNEASKFVNKANKWVSSLSVDDPEIEALINLHDDDVINCADEAWNKCMASELNPSVKEKKEINSKPANTLASFDLFEDVPQDHHDVPNNKPSGNRSDFRTAAQQLGIDQVKKNDEVVFKTLLHVNS